MITAAARKYVEASEKPKPRKRPIRHQRFGVMTVVVCNEVEIVLFHSSLKGLEQAYRLVTRNVVHFDESKVSPVTVSNRRVKKLL
jgi:hypothetical protein